MTISPWAAAVLLLLACAPGAGAQTAPAARDTVRADTAAPDPLDAYFTDLADPWSGAAAVGLGVWDHLWTEPDEWGGGADALLQRVMSRAGGHIVGTTARHGLASALGRSTHEERCGCSRVYDRVSHAFLDTLTDRDLATGERVFSEPFIAGVFAGSLAPVLWHPDASVIDGLRAGTYSVLLALAGRVALDLLDPNP